MEIEITEEDGVFIEQVVREGGYCVDCRIVCVVIYVDDQERMCA